MFSSWFPLRTWSVTSRRHDTNVELLNHRLYKLKYLCSSLRKQSSKFKKLERRYYTKIAKELERKDERSARVYVRQSVHFGDLALRSLELSSRVEMVHAMTEMAIHTGTLTEEMVKTTSLIAAYTDPMATMEDLTVFDDAYQDIMLACNSMNATFNETVLSHEADAGVRENEVLEWVRDNLTDQVSSQFPDVPSHHAVRDEHEIDAVRVHKLLKSHVSEPSEPPPIPPSPPPLPSRQLRRSHTDMYGGTNNNSNSLF